MDSLPIILPAAFSFIVFVNGVLMCRQSRRVRQLETRIGFLEDQVAAAARAPPPQVVATPIYYPPVGLPQYQRPMAVATAPPMPSAPPGNFIRI